MMDWRHAYHAHMRDKFGQLIRARQHGVTHFRIAGRSVNPTRLSDRQAEDLARLDAEQTANGAIIRHNEEVARRAA